MRTALSWMAHLPAQPCARHRPIDLFVAPTIGFDLLYVLVIVRLERRKLVWMNVTPHPTAEWIARQITEALPAAERHWIGAARDHADDGRQSWGGGQGAGAITT